MRYVIHEEEETDLAIYKQQNKPKNNGLLYHPWTFQILHKREINSPEPLFPLFMVSRMSLAMALCTTKEHLKCFQLIYGELVNILQMHQTGFYDSGIMFCIHMRIY